MIGLTMVLLAIGSFVFARRQYLDVI
jgi:hypothetical protein